jgi:tetratricopeptide (TPR) repeat protein
MPTTTYMVNDPRHDHSFRVPRPDLSVALGVPNPCARCHTDRPARWAAAQVQIWYGHAPRGYQRYAEALSAASLGSPGAADQLLAIASDSDQPAIARASALARLGPAPSARALEALGKALRDEHSLVRRAAAGALEHAEAGLRAQFLAPLLDDPVRAVRMEAARALADIAPDRLTDAERTAFDRGVEEYIAAQRFNADRAESHVNLGLLYAAQGRMARAEAALRAALELDPRLVPASVNLADLYRAAGREGEAERVLRDVLGRDPRSAASHHALGLLLVRQKRMPEALRELETAAHLAPESARYGYVYGVGLNDTGRPRQAIEALLRVLARHPYDRDTLGALVAYSQAQGNARQALTYGRRLVELDPGNPQLRQLVERLDAESRR